MCIRDRTWEIRAADGSGTPYSSGVYSLLKDSVEHTFEVVPPFPEPVSYTHLGALLEESGGSGAEELGRELEDELLEEEERELLEEELELLLGLGSNSNESPPPAELLDESPSSTS